MKDRYVSCARLLVLALMLVLTSTPAFAQASSASALSGVVLDADGGAIPGATVTVKNNATGVTSEAVSNSTGQFSFPGLNAGTYTLTVSLTGFKTFVANEVRLIASQPATVTAKLEVGALTEVVEVKATSELVQTQSTAVASTLTTEQLSQLPLVSRNALYSLAMLPGVSASSNNLRNSQINGLPNNTVNITIDGIGTGNALQSGDGFFSMVTPRMDAVEEVTVTGAVPGVGAGAGSVQIAFITRSGSNQFDSSAYLYLRDPKFNSNYYFNEVNGLDKNEAKLRTWGARVGGPIILPGYNGRGKAFFFLNFEHQHLPSSATRTRTILNPTATQGIFTWDQTIAGVVTQRQVNVMDLARNNGFAAVTPLDPTIQSMLGLIREATGKEGRINTLNNRNTQQYVYQSESIGDQYAPTIRLDYNLSDKHRLTGTYYWQRFVQNVDLLNNQDAQFPGMPNSGAQNSYRTTGSVGIRSTLTSNIVNEFKGGWQWSPNDFFAKTTKDTFDNQGGYAIVMPLVTDVWVTNNPQPRNTTTWSVSNDLSWLKGSHSFTFGGSFAGVHNRQQSYNLVPGLGMGYDSTNDPTVSIFNTTNFPGASNGQLNDARAIYALLTGRVTSVTGTARLDSATGKYVYLGDLAQKSKGYSIGAYASDSWRVSPTLTLNGGLRWDVQLPFTPVTNTFSTTTLEDMCGVSGIGSGPGGRPCNMFQTAIRTGKAQPTYIKYDAGNSSYKTKWNNLGYNVGVAWRPNVQDGFMRSLLGDPDQATVRAGYSMTYNVERIDRFNAGGNPGGTTSATRNNTTSAFCLVCPNDPLYPVFISQKGRLGAPAFPESPVYPILASTSTNLNLMSADLRTPRVHSYSVGIQRSVGPDMALEVRYVGNRSKYTWGNENWNERTIFENGFYDEFLLARANLKANIAGGKGNTFAYTGIPGTSPLPIHQAYLSGRSGADVTNPARYTAAQYTTQAFLNRFSIYEPNVEGAAEALDTTAFRVNGLAAGLPVNFFVMNPAVGAVNMMMDGGGTKYNSIQVELRRRLSKGLLVSTNYTYARQYGLSLQTLRLDRFEVNNTQQPHEFKGNFTYEVPVGRGRRFGSDMNPILNGILGNWEFSGNARFQTSRFRIQNAKLVGMTADELAREFKIRIYKDAAGATTVYSMPADIITNTRAAYSTDATTANGYSVALGAPTGRYIKPSSDENCISIYRGDCNAPDIEINGPLYAKVDLRIKKLFPFLSRGSIEVNLEALNAFANINFNHALNPGDGTGIFQVTTAATDISTSGDPGGRVGQLVFRINW